ncbi:hypothetical protein [Desulfopila inferna]|uniref:hypothetical protein n=1 Tax=Desulfopila inferna TaxID=468528 RepID=UPI001964001E|nr:hypothetical protein [Desulfopila inferna]MBM9606487.1 hypothetical protein [Desulfopila inferna]
MIPKRTYVEKMKDQLNNWQLDIDSLRVRADSIEEPKRADHHQKIAFLEKQKQETEKRLQEIDKADEGSWEALKEGYEKLREDMQESIKNAQTEL